MGSRSAQRLGAFLRQRKRDLSGVDTGDDWQAFLVAEGVNTPEPAKTPKTPRKPRRLRTAELRKVFVNLAPWRWRRGVDSRPQSTSPAEFRGLPGAVPLHAFPTVDEGTSAVQSTAARVWSSETQGLSESMSDNVVIEEPLEIRLGFGPADDRQQQSICITMRTPGSDIALARGFAISEGIVESHADIAEVAHCGPIPRGQTCSNVVRIELNPGIEVELDRVQRNFYATSSCGICGKASLAAIELRDYEGPPPGMPMLQATQIAPMLENMRARQRAFTLTGGLHAAALFNDTGTLLVVEEDVGRHNAVDKVIGHLMGHGGDSSGNKKAGRIICVSGRVSFEIVQKALAAGVSIIIAVSAPSSLAISLARRYGMTLIGFARANKFNVYTGSERLFHA